jgi:hypothetical protein
MYIFYLFEAVYISHDISLEKKGLQCRREVILSPLCSVCPVYAASLVIKVQITCTISCRVLIHSAVFCQMESPDFTGYY